MAFASVNRNGEPRVSPLAPLFIRGRFTLSTGTAATKLRHLRRNPACSAVHMDGDRVAIAVDGEVEWLERDHPDHGEIHRAWMAQYGSRSVFLGRHGIVFFRIAPRNSHVGVCLPPRGVPRTVAVSSAPSW